MCVLLPLSNFVEESGVEQRRGLMMESTPVGLRETCAVAMGKQINLLEFYSTTYQSPSSTLGLSQPPAESLPSAYQTVSFMRQAAYPLMPSSPSLLHSDALDKCPGVCLVEFKGINRNCTADAAHLALLLEMPANFMGRVQAAGPRFTEFTDLTASLKSRLQPPIILLESNFVRPLQAMPFKSYQFLLNHNCPHWPLLIDL